MSENMELDVAVGLLKGAARTIRELMDLLDQVKVLPEKWSVDFGKGGIPFPLQEAMDELEELLNDYEGGDSDEIRRH